MAVNVISNDLIDSAFRLCPRQADPAQFPRPNEVMVYHHSVNIVPATNLEVESSRILVDVDENDGVLQIVAPKAALALPPATKMTKLNALRARRTKQLLASMSWEHEGDARLCAYLQRHKIPLANVYGPYLTRNAAGSVDLELGLALVPNAVVTAYSQQVTSLKFLARALNDLSLINPQCFTASPVELLRAITKEPTDLPPDIMPRGLRTPLLPYQRETIEWCLKKEGKCLADAESVVALDESIRDVVINPPLGWRKAPNSEVWVNPYWLKTSSLDPIAANTTTASGHYKGKGLLAEEMGLGKTLEIISVILLNPRPHEQNAFYYNDSEEKITKSKATLVIVPRSIINQWRDEVKMHAPALNVVVVTRDSTTIDDIVNADIVLITYFEFTKWLPVSLFKPRRQTRYNYHQQHANNNANSLAHVEFWRVVLDEVQMVSTGASAAAHAARNVPRVHAWAASGTPVKQSLEDLKGITYFLDLQPFVERPAWQRLISSSVDFHHTMSIIGLRHTKPMVAKQLYIPPQHRHLLLLKLSAVERVRYDRIYRDFQRDAENPSCNLSAWLMRLRQAYFIAVSGNEQDLLSTGANNNNSNMVALTLDQVLTRLVDEADGEIWALTRDTITSEQELGQLLDKADNLTEAIAVWKRTEQTITSQLVQTKSSIEKCQDRGKDLESTIKQNKIVPSSTKKEADDELMEDDEYGDGQQNAVLQDAKREQVVNTNQLRFLRVKLKSLNELLHRTYFFLGTGYFRASQRLRLKHTEEEIDTPALKEQFDTNSIEETKYYALAESLRNDILNEAEGRVEKLISRAQSSRMEFVAVNRHCKVPKAEVADKLSDFCTEINDTLLGLLSAPLMEKQVAQSTAGIQLEDDYYTKTLDLQEHAFVYLETLQLLLRDRAVAINGGTIQPRTTAIEASKEKDLGKRLIDRRDDIVEFLHYDRHPLHATVRVVGTKMDIADKLKAEVRTSQHKYTVLRDLYNARVEYYKQLQDISDQVTDVEIGSTVSVEELLMRKKLHLAHLDRKMRENVKNQTYLRNLAGSDHSDTQKKDESDTDLKANCIICFDPIKTGAVTPCGHSFCADCLSNWIASQRTCPLCKRSVSPEEVHTFLGATVKREDINNEISTPEGNGDRDSDHARDLFSPIPNALYNKIHRIEILRLYGIKIDMIVKLVKHLRGEDPSAQIIVFSQWLTVLKVLFNAFAENGIVVASSTKLANNIKADVNAFREDPRVACLLLHAKTDVAGLTLVNANHVFLCEPLMNTALELQAVSRINRIGQTRETHIWQFCVEDTVEQTILGATTRERMLQTMSVGSMDGADSSTLAEASSRGSMIDRKSGAEIVDDNKLLRRILLPN